MTTQTTTPTLVHTRRAGLLLVVGLAVAAAFDIGLPLG